MAAAAASVGAASSRTRNGIGRVYSSCHAYRRIALGKAALDGDRVRQATGQQNPILRALDAIYDPRGIEHAPFAARVLVGADRVDLQLPGVNALSGRRPCPGWVVDAVAGLGQCEPEVEFRRARG